MPTKIACRANDGTPLSVESDDGFAMTHRPYVADEDGWIEDQLDPGQFVAIQIGNDTSWLVQRVNSLQRENFRLKQELKMWKKAAGFGD